MSTSGHISALLLRVKPSDKLAVLQAAMRKRTAKQAKKRGRPPIPPDPSEKRERRWADYERELREEQRVNAFWSIPCTQSLWDQHAFYYAPGLGEFTWAQELPGLDPRVWVSGHEITRLYRFTDL